MKIKQILAFAAVLGFGIFLVGCDGTGDAALSDKEKKSQEEYLKGGIKFDKNGQPANAPPEATK